MRELVTRAHAVWEQAATSLRERDANREILQDAVLRLFDTARRWSTIEAEYQRTVSLLLRVTGRERLLDGAPVLQRSIGLRNPYVDSLSELQVRWLARLRRMDPDDPERERVRRLVQLTINGVAAGLQSTG